MAVKIRLRQETYNQLERPYLHVVTKFYEVRCFEKFASVTRGVGMKSHRLCCLALLAVLVLGLSGLSFGQVFGQVSLGGFGVNVGIGVAPPPLPVYDQPQVPAAGYVWTPGYWAWDDQDGYYWVPGTWVQPPEVGLVWTPGYWGWDDADETYDWYPGYWGNEVGFYGGVDYGYGYPGDGYYGGRWQGNQFYYNNAVNNVGSNVVTTVYSNPAPQSAASAEHVSFNGGQGGTQAHASQQQVQARQTAKVKATPAQQQQVQAAKANPQTHAKNNGGKPAVAATSKPGDFSHAVQAKAAGGHVDPKVLQANAKSTKVNHNPAPRNPANKANANPSGKAAANTHEASKTNEPASANKGERNVPKPSNAGAENGTRARATEPNTPKPENSRHDGNAAGMPQSEGAGHHANAEPAKPASHEASRPEKAPASKEAAPKGEKGNEKPENNKDQNPK